MAEQLKSLLERIQKDGVEKAEAEAKKIVAEANDKAKAIVNEANEKKNDALKKAEEGEAAFAARARKSLQQAARDAILLVGDALNTTLENLVDREVTEAMTDDTLKEMLAKVVEAYCSKESGPSRAELLLSPEQQKAIEDYFMSKYRDRLRAGLEIKADDGIVRGFKVSLVNEQLEHDFTRDAIAEVICGLLRPQLAEIVKEAARKAGEE